MALLLTGCNTSTSSEKNHAHQSGHQTVASTSWTALIAKTAGAKDVTILAPVEMKHPNEYDFKPSDVEKVKKADMVVYSEYEPFMKKVLEASAVPEANRVMVVTENTPDNLKKQVRSLAKMFESESAVKEWEVKLDATFTSIQAASGKLDAASKKAVVQAYMVPVAKSMGFEVVGTYGPAEVTPAKAAELAALKPAVVIDNFHFPQGAEIAKIANSKIVELRNYPATEQQTMIELIEENAAKLGLKK
ncbi:high-affinity zinc transporter periplasmic component [compost metagenome]